MTRVARRLVLAALTVILVVVPGRIATAQPAPAPPATAAAGNALADCSARTGRLSIAFLVDESASLQQTDPNDRRVEAIATALRGLANAVERGGGAERPFTVEVALLGFGVGTAEVVGWTSLDGGSLPGLLQAAAGFAERDRAIDTDYAAAILGAQDTLNAAAASGPTCTAVLWFTDGQYDIEPRNTGETKSYAPEIELRGADSAAALEQAGKDLLCRDAGVIDGLRTQGTQLLAVALSTDIAPEDRDFLQSMAEGSAGTVRCGVARPPGSPAVGAYLETDDVGQLLTPFFDLVNDVSGGTRLPPGEGLPVCPNDPCAEGTHRFVVDPGITSFNLLAVTSAPDIDIQLRSPETPPSPPANIATSAPTGSQPLGSATLRWTWVSVDALLADVTVPADAGPWNGEWEVTFIDRTGLARNAVADAQIYVFGDLEPYLEPTEFRAGEDNAVRVGVQHREGTPVDESLFADVTVDVVIADPATGTRETIAVGEPGEDGVRAGTWRAPAPDFPATVNVSATVTITTASGQALTPTTRTFAVAVAPPSSYPTVSPSELRFGTVEGTDPNEVVLTVTGGPQSGGCVWVGGAAVAQAPTDAGTVSLTPQPAAVGPDSCLKVASGEQRDLVVALSPDAATNGAASGSLEVVLASDTNPDILRTDLAWSAALQKPLDTAKAVELTVALMLLGLLLPLLLMWLVNWYDARFDAPGDLRVARFPVRVTEGGGVSRTDGAPGLTVQPSDFRAIDSAGRSRSFEAAGLWFRSKMPLSPFSAPSGRVSSSRDEALGSLPPPRADELHEAVVPFGLAGTAIVCVPLAALDQALRRQPAAISHGLGGGTRPLPPDPISSDEGTEPRRRPDLEIELVVFAPSGEISRYSTHFDGHHSAVAIVVDALYERRHTNLQSEPLPERDDPGLAPPLGPAPGEPTLPTSNAPAPDRWDDFGPPPPRTS